MWEALDGRLKNKLEIQWYDIMSINATYPDDGHGTLDVVCPQGLLGTHFKKLIHCDPHLNFLNQQAEGR
nr:hypothetical protein [Tanacetum cinerariifolium]